jgi:hypothetical protein
MLLVFGEQKEAIVNVETPPVAAKLRRHGPAAPPHFNLSGYILHCGQKGD